MRTLAIILAGVALAILATYSLVQGEAAQIHRQVHETAPHLCTDPQV